MSRTKIMYDPAKCSPMPWAIHQGDDPHAMAMAVTVIDSDGIPVAYFGDMDDAVFLVEAVNTIRITLPKTRIVSPLPWSICDGHSGIKVFLHSSVDDRDGNPVAFVGSNSDAHLIVKAVRAAVNG